MVDIILAQVMVQLWVHSLEKFSTMVQDVNYAGFVTVQPKRGKTLKPMTAVDVAKWLRSYVATQLRG